MQSGPKASLYLTLVGILAGFLSTFWSFGYQRTAAKMQEYLDGANVAKVKKQQVSRRCASVCAGNWGKGACGRHSSTCRQQLNNNTAAHTTWHQLHNP